MDLIAIKKLGDELGHGGPELRNFVDRQVQLYEEQQNRERERQKEEREKRLKNRELDVREKELEQKTKAEKEQREHELKIKQLELQMNGKKEESKDEETRKGSVNSFTRVPKLPNFNPDLDDLPAYISRFETTATQNKWSEEEKFIGLSNLLTGECLQILHSLQDKSYNALRDALFKRYKYTEEGFHDRFRKTNPREGEDFGNYVNRLVIAKDRWLESAGVKKDDFKGLSDLVLKEQIYESCSSELVTFLKERDPKDTNKIVSLAEQFQTAHPNAKLGKSHNLCAMTSGAHERGRNMIRGHEGKRNASAPNFATGRPHNRQTPRSGYYNYNVPQSDHTNGPRAPNQYNHARAHFQPRMSNQYMGRQQFHFNHYRPRQNFGRQNHTRHQFDHRQVNERVHLSSSLLGDASNIPLFKGFVNNVECTVMRDTGSSMSAASAIRVLPSQMTGRNIECTLINGLTMIQPTAVIDVATPFYEGSLEVLVFETCVADLILGNDIDPNIHSNLQKFRKEKHDHDTDGSNDSKHITAPVTTRSHNQKHKKEKSNVKESVTQTSVNTQSTNLKGSTNIFGKFSKETFKQAQEQDKSLSKVRYLADKEMSGYGYKEGLIIRKFKGKDNQSSIVVPSSLRMEVLKLAHDSVFAGHLGITATKKTLMSRFTWPGVTKDIANYIKSCEICQKHAKRKPKLPLGKMEMVKTPFEKVAIDIIGPLSETNKKNNYILTLVDFSTRWPDAVPLKSIKTENVAEALFDMFSRLGIPKVILSDNGRQLISDSMKETYKLLGIEQKLSAPLHPQSHGLVERCNQTIQKTLVKLAEENPSEWDTLLTPTLFALRQMPNASTGFPPFELMYGRKVRGPIDVIADSCSDRNEENDELIHAYSYAQKLKAIIKKSNKTASQAVKNNSQKQKDYADQHSQYRSFRRGQKVMILLPKNNSRIYHNYQGPFQIINKKGDNYFFRINNSIRCYHANLLKTWFQRKPSEDVRLATLAFIPMSEEEEIEEKEAKIEYLTNKSTQNFKNVELDENLTPTQRAEVKDVLSKFKKTLTDVPGRTDVLEHDIRLTDPKPFKVHQYPTPFRAKEAIEKEIETMLEQEIIRPSSSPYCSPITVVSKPDGNIRLCIDFRKLNAITIFDNEPIPQMYEMVTRITKAKYFTKLDLTKGYWQIPLKESCKQYTAFQTSLGLMEFNYLPFGLSTAAPTFQRAMNKVLGHLKFITNYFDDVLIFSETWSEHLNHIKETLQTLEKANLTVKPSKCQVGCREVNFLGHIVGKGNIKPDPKKTEKILTLTTPKTKKDVRKICGLINYYRKFIPFFSHKVAPLTSLLKKEKPNQIIWNADCEKAIGEIKQALASKPILAIPDLNKQFIVRADASSKAIGAVLLQKHNDILKPCYYVSRKLLQRECNYPIIEKECLAIVFALHQFSKYLLMSPFIVQSDHKPLTFLKMNKTKNARLLRYALSLQPFTFGVEPIKGTENSISDILSRF